jgi:hypothetical protein
MTMLAYHVVRAFARDGRYYTRQNADEIKKLSRDARDELIENGNIIESNVPGEEPEPVPPAPLAGSDKAASTSRRSASRNKE